MIILTTTFNCQDYIEKCLFSLMIQTHSNFRCFITDDLSTDNTVNKIKNFIKNDDRFTLIVNEEKKFQPGNYDQVLRNNNSIDDMEVIVELDGDDWLPDSSTLERIQKVYHDPNIWIANGSFIYSNGNVGFSSQQIIDSDLRNSRFTASHIRTWRAFLWRKISQEDLKDENGIYWRVTGDLSFMYPMLEMAGNEHYKYMKEINYVYNEQNPINDHKVDLTLVNEVADKIRKMKPYDKIL
jgi:glycosyltransferase involved in cell wall biosynthesis